MMHYHSRDSDSISITLPKLSEELEEYRILKVFEFDSERKMMSVVLKKGDQVLVFSKGADSAIEKCLHH